jgi:hypothetical protein
MVHVEACAVSEHGVSQVALYQWGLRSISAPTPGISVGRFIVKIPSDVVIERLCVSVDEQRRRRYGIRANIRTDDAVFGFDTEHLCEGHQRS